jgi:hypothetical protein
MGVVVAVVLGLCAAASAAAAAEPALYECAKAEKVGGKYTGRYKNSKCTEEDAERTGEHEAREGVGKGKAFKLKGAGANWEILGWGGWACTASTMTGKWSNPTEATGVLLTFTGCEVGHKQIENDGAALGEIKTVALTAEIGYIEGGSAKHEVGVRLSPESGAYLVPAMHMAELEMRLSGAIIGRLISQTNVFTTELWLLYQQSAGVQQLTKLEGGPDSRLFMEMTSGGGEFGAPGELAWANEFLGKSENLMVKA